MLKKLLYARQGHEISDEETEAYILGFKDACAAMRSDEVYYRVTNAKPGLSKEVFAAADYVEKWEYE